MPLRNNEKKKRKKTPILERCKAFRWGNAIVSSGFLFLVLPEIITARFCHTNRGCVNQAPFSVATKPLFSTMLEKKVIPSFSDSPR